MLLRLKLSNEVQVIFAQKSFLLRKYFFNLVARKPDLNGIRSLNIHSLISLFVYRPLESLAQYVKLNMVHAKCQYSRLSL